MATLTLPSLDEVRLSPVESAANTIVAVLSDYFDEVTETSLHDGTRPYKLLNLDREYENLRLVNVYNATRAQVLDALDEILEAANANDEFRLMPAPRGYKVGPNLVDVSSIAYAITLLVMSTNPEDRVPQGLIFIQTYASNRADTPQAVKAYKSERQHSNEPEGEFEYE